MKSELIIAGFGAAMLVATPRHAAQAAELFIGRCHMEICSWFSIEEKELLGTSSDGALFKVVTKWWESEHPGGEYEQRARRTGGEQTVSYFFCSKTRPALIWADDKGEWNASHLAPGSPLGPSGAAESATRQYFVVCHAMSTDDDVIEEAKKFGYPPTEFPPDDRKLTRPEDFIKSPAASKP